MRAHTACANQPLFIKKGCNSKCQVLMIAEQFLVRTTLAGDSAQVFAAAHCDLVYDAIDFDGMVNDVIRF